MTAHDTLDESVLLTELTEYNQWICWREQERDGKPTKVPITPGEGAFASATDAQTWTSIDKAFTYAETGDVDGIGFVFTDDDPFVGVDLDDCRDPETGVVDETAADIIDRLDSYTEQSPSGTGYHVIVQGELPGERNRKGTVEMYDSARFFTVTGDRVDETVTTIATRQDALTAVHREYVQDDTVEQTNTASSSETTQTSTTDIDLDDAELIEKAKSATNGEKFERLWNGDTLNYESQSEADMALCHLLAFWTGGDQTRMDQLFRRSGLLREKWDEVHYADGSTYGEKTIERAVANTSEFYDPDSGDEASLTNRSSEATSTDAERDESDRSRAYLTEKNRLLTERVAELEETLKQKTERIETLEAEIQRLNEELSGRNRKTDHSHEEQTVDTGADGEGTETVSMWEWAKRLFGSGSQ